VEGDRLGGRFRPQAVSGSSARTTRTTAWAGDCVPPAPTARWSGNTTQQGGPSRKRSTAARCRSVTGARATYGYGAAGHTTRPSPVTRSGTTARHRAGRPEKRTRCRPPAPR
jgi:hypothetical protein